VSYAHERQQVMFTHRLHRKRPGDDQLVIFGVVGKCGELEGTRAEHFGVRACHPSWGSCQAFGVEVHTERDQERSCRLLGGGQVGSGLRFDDM
jgi:hypothetical protein